MKYFIDENKQVKVFVSKNGIYSIGTIYYNSKKKFSMSVLAAMEANRIATERSNLDQEFEKIQYSIKATADLGRLAIEYPVINGFNVDQLQKLGYKCWMNEGLGTWVISWREPEKASIAMQENTEFHYESTGNLCHNQILFSEDYNKRLCEENRKQQEENAKIQHEAWIKSEKQKSRHEAIVMAEKVHSGSYLIGDASKRHSELLTTTESIYQWLIKDL